MEYFLYYVYLSKSYAGPRGSIKLSLDLQQMPIWCGPLDVVNQALDEQGYVQFEVAFGRVAALPDR